MTPDGTPAQRRRYLEECARAYLLKFAPHVLDVREGTPAEPPLRAVPMEWIIPGAHDPAITALADAFEAADLAGYQRGLERAIAHHELAKKPHGHDGILEWLRDDLAESRKPVGR